MERDPDGLIFNHTAFNLLMQNRIYNILLVCSNYDAFLIEEDGRIDEKISNEYTSLNLRLSPQFFRADSSEKVFEILENKKIDLIIEMMNTGKTDPFELAHQIKAKQTHIPVIVLTHFSREVSLKFQNEDLSAIDNVFSWLGNTDLIIAIIKLFEDRMNVANDVQAGVQVILVVEDSVRYISQILPVLYKMLFNQSSRVSAQEGLNDSQQMLMKRGRPKILLAKTYEEALTLFDTYKENILGVISDISFKKSKERQAESKEGVNLCRHVKETDAHIPVLIQSSDATNELYAKEMNVGFIHKTSRTASNDLQTYITRYFGFGDFIFRDPETLQEIGKATDLLDLKRQLLSLPDHVLAYHAVHNDLSRWLQARSLFSIGSLIRSFTLEDFHNNITEVKQFLYDAISTYRLGKGQGVIARFESAHVDPQLIFSRIGDGSIGGKARGLAFLNLIIKKYNLYKKYSLTITIPRTVVICTDVFDEFMEMNNLNSFALSDHEDVVIHSRFINSNLPDRLYRDLYAYAGTITNPVAVRSSSKLEDSQYQPFAGVYSTYMLPFSGNKDVMVKMVADAVKSVYASVFYKKSKTYITATSNVIDEEKMGIILQEVCGQLYGNRFYPVMSGVARSLNFYPIAPEKVEDGIAYIAYGLGKYVVDGNSAIRFSPKYPKKALQLTVPELAVRDSQKFFLALNMSKEGFKLTHVETCNLLKLKIKEAQNDQALVFAASTYDMENRTIREGPGQSGNPIITFSQVLNHNSFPLADILQTILSVGQNEMNSPVELEFAVDVDVKVGSPTFYLLQIRPVIGNDQGGDVSIKEIKKENTLVYSKSALGNGIFENLKDIVYVKIRNFNPAHNKEIASELEKINELIKADRKNYILIGPGRWGSNDPWLGIPVIWSQISEVRIIVENEINNYQIEPSQGTHFFQNLTAFRIGYLSVSSLIKENFCDLSSLEMYKALNETEHLIHLRFDKPLKTIIDGRNNTGVIYKPEK